MTRAVTERDLRMPEFASAQLEDLEFRADGKIVRKDRWENGIHSIAGIVGINRREGFEIPEVVEEVEKLRSTPRLPDGWAFRWEENGELIFDPPNDSLVISKKQGRSTLNDILYDLGVAMIGENPYA
jgi:hypothetical protein